MADTGNGTTISFATTGFTGNIHVVGETEQELGKLEDSHLQTETHKTYVPDDLSEPGEFDVEYEWQGQSPPPSKGTVETITITYPVPPGLSNGATLAGSGFIRKRTFPKMQNGQLQMGKLTIAWDGKTGPAYTPAS